ncbi:CPBP family intramembrane metalloprotease [Nibribacter ruber]|uniref:CPBP family intramembrane metalloprotease n=1 Tax=Nibribacter ruber TaxID=2698458 RepID=A0A6P1P2Y0_9BACT|nr:CPBP family intramembrane glutamic endopeptidase [Nibribacter ruber]QHL88756.1 CPBP family intramembrane metalloprotease [Nibribacter ruber]
MEKTVLANHKEQPSSTTQTTPSWSILAGFLFIALTYHAGEYAMRFHQHIPLFLGCMLAVIPVAYLVAKWQGFKGLGAWGMCFDNPYVRLCLKGLVIGLVVYALALGTRLWLGFEILGPRPDTEVLIMQTLIFAAGTFLPSLAEDILTRGYLFGHFYQRMDKWSLILFSSVIYVLNHIYALTSGPSMLLYLFVLGIMLTIPLLYTRNLWYTVGAHWAGNIIYRVGNDVLQVREAEASFPAIWELTGFVLLLAVINYVVTKGYSSSAKLPGLA